MPTTLLFLEFIGTTELLVIALVALIVFGPRKLPEIGRTLGKSLAEFKRASEDFKRTWEFEVETERRQLESRTEAEQVAARQQLAAEPAAVAAAVAAEDPAGTGTDGPAPFAGADGPVPAPLTVPRGPAAYAAGPDIYAGGAADEDESAHAGALAGPGSHAAAESPDEPAAERVG